MKDKTQGILGEVKQKNAGGGKNKKIKKKKSVPNKKQNYHVRSQSTLNHSPEVDKFIPDTSVARQHKQELIFVKKFFNEVVDSYDFHSDNISQWIDSIKGQFNFSSISIDKLFDQNETTIFEDTFVSNDVSEYLKFLNNQLQQKRKKIIVNIQNDSFLVTKDSNRHQDTQEFKCRFITLLEQQVLQNRQNFIEKIKLNQSKYQQCNSQLSQLSQELLFLSKTYMQNNQKIKKLKQEVILKMSMQAQQAKTETETESETQKDYYQIIIKKNIMYAMKEHQIDFLNYFRRKQLEQRSFYVGLPQIKNEDQFFSYLKSKKPKKGKLAKYGLHTACSCCFSGYFQSYNPLIPCENCNLRCHKLCYNLKQKTCGNCSYQRLLKSDKEIVPYCIICKQKGQMTIKLKDKIYAHAFCLIAHNQWKIEVKSQIIEKKQLQKEYESYYNKNSNLLYAQNQYTKSQEKKCELIFQDILVETSVNMINKNQKRNIFDDQCFEMNQRIMNEGNYACHEKNPVNGQVCQLCTNDFHLDYFGECIKCRKKAHIFCAFFEGFKFQNMNNVQNAQNQKERSNRVKILFDCCSKSMQEKEKLKRSREYVLNRNRFLFQNM